VLSEESVRERGEETKSTNNDKRITDQKKKPMVLWKNTVENGFDSSS
jgi:hypothetical protein